MTKRPLPLGTIGDDGSATKTALDRFTTGTHTHATSRHSGYAPHGGTHTHKKRIGPDCPTCGVRMLPVDRGGKIVLICGYHPATDALASVIVEGADVETVNSAGLVGVFRR